jgi:hypothetical protein
MKKIALGAFVLVSLLIASCAKDSLNTDQLQSSNLATSLRGGGGGNDMGQHCMYGDTLTVDDLSQAILDYLAAEYPGETVVTVVSKHNGALVAVELSDGTVLLFNADGEYIGECGAGGPGNHHNGNHCMNGDTLTVDDLPQEVIDYIAAEYPDETITTVVSKHDGQAFAVELSNGSVYLFSADGTFIGECGTGGPGHTPGNNFCTAGDTLTVDDLPQAVLDYLAAEYPDETIVTVVSKHNGQAYAVELSNGSVYIFDADGEYLGECGTFGPGNGGPGHGGGHGGHGGPGHGGGGHGHGGGN